MQASCEPYLTPVEISARPSRTLREASLARLIGQEHPGGRQPAQSRMPGSCPGGSAQHEKFIQAYLITYSKAPDRHLN
jgi:hypothetical protein